jgi:hypothetical protein
MTGEQSQDVVSPANRIDRGLNQDTTDAGSSIHRILKTAPMKPRPFPDYATGEWPATSWIMNA